MARKLAAIFVADVVGYSGLMERDEKGTFERLKAYRTGIVEPEVGKHDGRVFKLTGDGLLADFPSVVGAVECALAVQKEMAARNAGAARNERIDLRIGINLGDVIGEGDDLYGEGVNIAARLQQLAEPGGIAVSQTVVDHLGNKLPVHLEAIGEQQVKGIAKPVVVYRIPVDDTERSRKPLAGWRNSRSRRGLFLVAAVLLIAVAAGLAGWFQPWNSRSNAALSDKPSLVVLPFDSLSDDKQQGYLADGMTEDLTTALARAPGLFVISRNSAFTYKGKTIEPTQVAKDLGVRYVLEGSIRRVGDDMRINAQLIDGNTGAHIWAERFDGAWNDVFKLQDQVVGQVASALKLRLVAGPRMVSAAGGTDNPAAYDLYLRGYELIYATAPAEAVGFYRQAVALDPNFGQAWAELAYVYWSALGTEESEKALGIADYSDGVSKIREYLSEAGKHPSSPYYQLLADLLVWQRKPEEAIVVAQRAIALDPSSRYAYEQMGVALAYQGRGADAEAYLDAAWQVDPQPRPYRHFLDGLVAFCLGRYEDAIASLAKADPREFDPANKQQRLFLLAAAHAYLDQPQAAASAKAELDTIGQSTGNEMNRLRAIQILPFKQPADIERLWSGLGKAGVPEFPYGYSSKDQLTGEEVRALVFGHEFRGQSLESGEPYRRVTTPDGAAEVTIGSFVRKGSSWVEWNFLCSLWDIALEADCAAIIRNPAGTREAWNEHIVVLWHDRTEFSVAK